MPLVPRAANRVWQWINRGSAKRFRRALDRAEQVQQRKLTHYLRRNEQTDIGRTLGFAAISLIRQYQDRVPLHDYDALSPYIDRIVQGRSNVLTAEPVTRLMPSSGSSRAAKLIPYTRSLQREFSAAIAPWIDDLYRHDPLLRDGVAYWSISPSTTCAIPSRVPIGYDSDSAYLGGVGQRLIDLVMAVPSLVARVKDPDAFRYLTLLFLLRQPQLRLISVWHPTFLTLLMQALPAHWESLIGDIARGGCSSALDLPPPLREELSTRLPPRPDRARLLQRLSPDALTAIWPGLRLISCWADGNAAGSVAPLRASFPGVAVQAKGLLATEAFVSSPYAGKKVLAASSHVFEFLNSSDRPHLPHEVETGGQYTLAVTTAGGLYRYRLHDRVRVTGRLGVTPTLDFLGKTDLVVDLRGEKLNDVFVSSVLDALCPAASFRLLAPDSHAGDPAYVLFVETDAAPAPPAARLDELLRANPHYKLCRDLRQLGPARVVCVAAGAYGRYVRTLSEQGQRIGNIKPVALSSFDGWSAVFDEIGV